LRGRNPNQVAAAAKKWADLQNSDRLKLEALWVSWGADRLNRDLLLELLNSNDHRVRSAAVQVLRNNLSNFEDENKLLLAAAGDSHGRVRLSALTTATYLPQSDGLEVIDKAKEKGVGALYQSSLNFAESYLQKSQHAYEEETHKVVVPEHLSLSEGRLFIKGAEIYEKEGYCGTCHQENGMGLPDAGFPPLADTKWVNGDQDRLIKLTLKGLMGPIVVKGRDYPGLVPMTPFESLLDDYDTAAVLTFIRNSFGNKAEPILPWQVNKLRTEIKGKQGFYTPAELLEEHPHSN
jgi:mono/diheme cytochrome c family protein